MSDDNANAIWCGASSGAGKSFNFTNNKMNDRTRKLHHVDDVQDVDKFEYECEEKRYAGSLNFSVYDENNVLVDIEKFAFEGERIVCLYNEKKTFSSPSWYDLAAWVESMLGSHVAMHRYFEGLELSVDGVAKVQLGS